MSKRGIRFYPGPDLPEGMILVVETHEALVNIGKLLTDQGLKWSEFDVEAEAATPGGDAARKALAEDYEARKHSSRPHRLPNDARLAASYYLAFEELVREQEPKRDAPAIWDEWARGYGLIGDQAAEIRAQVEGMRPMWLPLIDESTDGGARH
jgi:hypothetical protein